jgi:Domain of unknown function (DUF4082)
MPSTLGVVAAAKRNAPPPFTPTSITGCVGWWDADDATTFTYSSGTLVSQWRDKSGGNHHANNIGSPNRDTTLNGRAVIRFPTASGARFLITGFMSSFTAGEVFVVVDLLTISASNAGLWNYVSTDGSAQYFPYQPNGQVYENWGSTVRSGFDPVVSLLDPHVYNVRTAAGSYVAAIDGITRFSTATNTVAFGSGSPQIPHDGAGIDGSIAEMVIYNRVLNTTERQQIESYLTAKWIPAPTYGPEQRITISGTPDNDVLGDYSLATKVQFARAGRITGFRYYRRSGTTATLQFRVWSNAGVLLGGPVNDTGSGATYRTITFPTPVAVTAGATLTCSVGATGGGNFPRLIGGTGFTNTADCTVISVGVYGTPSTVFPATTLGAAAYVEPIYEPQL